jgi:branched-chain amino acid transport system substrate-binding protein
MAAEEINASDSKIKVEIVNDGKVVDDAGDAKQAINAYNSLMPQDPEAVVGAFFSSVTLPMAQLAKDHNMLLLAAGATNQAVTEVGPTIFRDCFIDPYQGKMAVQFAVEKGVEKAAIIYAKDDDYSNGLKDAFVENAESNGIEIVYIGECTTKDTDFTAQASQAVASGADFVFYPAFLDTVPLLVQQVRDAGFEGIIMGGDGWDGSDTTGIESYFENTYFTNHYSSEDTAPTVKAFVTKYTETYGDDSLNACAALYYDAIYMLVEAAENGGGTDTASLVEGMDGMTFTGVGGTFTMDENRNAEKSVVINTFENGKIKWLMTLEP